MAKASNEVVELLSEHWAIFAPGCAFLPSLLRIGLPLTSNYRFNIYNVPAIFPGFLQSPFSCNAFLHPHVERERFSIR